MLRQEKKLQSNYDGDCYIETAKCIFSLPEEEWGKCRMQYKDEDTFGFVLSNKYILGLYKYCRECAGYLLFIFKIFLCIQSD